MGDGSGPDYRWAYFRPGSSQTATRHSAASRIVLNRPSGPLGVASPKKGGCDGEGRDQPNGQPSSDESKKSRWSDVIESSDLISSH